MNLLFKNLTPFIALIFLMACGGSSSEKNGWKESRLDAQIDAQSYDVEVRYYQDEQNGLTVFSDDSDITDTNKDGLIFAIFQTNSGLQFDFVKYEERWGGKITEWEEEDGKIKGRGELNPESGLGKRIPVTFELDL